MGLIYLLLYREIISVCSENDGKHMNTPCGQHVETLLLILNLLVHKVTTELWGFKAVVSLVLS